VVVSVAHRARLVFKVNVVSKASPVLTPLFKVHRVSKVQSVTSVPVVSKGNVASLVILAPSVQKVQSGLLVRLVHEETKDHRVSKVIKVYLVPKVTRVNKVLHLRLQAQLVLQVQRVTLVHPVPKVTLVLMALKVIVVIRVLKEPRVIRVFPV
jgi:hypothetical protein